MKSGRRAAVLGSPIAHSLSPLLHRTAYDVLGLRGWTYAAYDVNAGELPAFIEQLDASWAGLSLTMPLKAAVLPLLDTCSPMVEVVGAANTVLPRAGGLHGQNTDVPGMVAALRRSGTLSWGDAAVLGGGATARSAIAAVAQLCSRVTVFLRSTARHDELARTADATGVQLEVRRWHEAADALTAGLVVNTTPAGAADELAAAVPERPGLLFDVVYSPWPTPVAAAWKDRGGQVVGGVELLVQQAVRQVALMTGSVFDEAETVRRLRLVAELALSSGRRPTA